MEISFIYTQSLVDLHVNKTNFYKATRKSRIQKSLRFFVTIYEHYCSDRRSIRTSQTSIQSGQLLFTMVSTLYRWTDIQPLSERALKPTMLR